MNREINQIFLIITLTVFVVAGIFIGSLIYRRYTGLTRSQSALLWLLAVALAAGFTICTSSPESTRWMQYGHFSSNDMSNEQTIFFRQVCFILLSLLTIPFITRLYLKWIGGRLTEAEKLSGIDGVRAWLGVGNIICAVLIPVCVWQLFGISLFAMLALTFGLLLAYPLLNMASQSAQPASAAPAEDLSSEREKVLQLLEAGKINAEESAELLNALSHSAPPPPKPAAAINPSRKMVLLGAALLLIGFFLPWFTVNVGDEMYQLSSQIKQNLNPTLSMLANAPGMRMNMTLHVSGGDIVHGLGWWILLLGITAAVLPFFANNLDGQTQKKVMLACLGAGAIILIYLFSNNLKYTSIGVLFSLAGYVLELIGTLQERPAAR
jgi:hypothetical protein